MSHGLLNKYYFTAFEFSGEHAIFTDPSTGGSPSSYPIPTISAIKGIIRAVHYGELADILPYKVEICNPITMENYLTNYRGPLRKQMDIHNNNSYQIKLQILTNVCYKVHFAVTKNEERLNAMRKISAKTLEFNKRISSPSHAFIEIFKSKLRQQRFHTIPYLGISEFWCDYVGPLRETTHVNTSINLTIPSLLRTVFKNGEEKPSPIFDNNIKIENGVVNFHYDEELMQIFERGEFLYVNSK